MERHYFLGGNTSEGFYSYYDYLIGQEEANKIYVIKGGPGTGKSTLMKKVGAWGQECGYSVDFLHCSSDPESLDGVILRDIKIAMVDGTAPHIVDPKNPGCVDTILHMGEFWDEESIRKNKESILKYNNEIKEYFNIAYRYIKAAGEIYDNIDEINRKCLGEDSVDYCAKRILNSISPKENIEPGERRKLFLSAISPIGIISYADTFKYGKTYVINSEVCGGSSRVINRVADMLLGYGYDTECFYSPLRPGSQIRHLAVPELDMFITSNDSETPFVIKDNHDVIDLDSMADGMEVSHNGIGLSYSKHTIDGMLKKTVSVIEKAKSTHDLLETCYVPHMDFDKINEYHSQVIKDIERHI